jgi:hypothetical protein
VGKDVGFGVGIGVGTGVGAGVGTGVGAGVGTGVGTGVGSGVGIAVGAGVGEGVGKAQVHTAHAASPSWFLSRLPVFWYSVPYRSAPFWFEVVAPGGALRCWVMQRWFAPLPQ